MRRLVLVPLLLGLTACVTTVPPEPIIITKEVRVPVTVPCVPKSLKLTPSYPDTDEELRHAGSERFLTLIIAGRDARLARLAELEPIIKGCRP